VIGAGSVDILDMPLADFDVFRRVSELSSAVSVIV